MRKEAMFEIIKELEFDTKKIVYKTIILSKNIEIFLFRPSVLSKRFKDYDVKKNFQIWLREDDREFRPNHMRVFIDLNLRIRSNPEIKKSLLLAFDNIFYGEDPEKELIDISKIKFEHYLNDLIIVGILAQLFIIEQEYGYHKESKFDPPTLFFQGWVREFIDNPKEIDNLCMSVCSRQPSLVKYVKLENKKDKKHNPCLSKLWYLN